MSDEIDYENIDFDAYCEREIEKQMNEAMDPETFYDAEPLERYRDTTKFPLTPINPTLLFDRVKEQLEKFNLEIVPYKLQKMIEDMGKGFNECIRLNNGSSDLPQTIIYSPKTGSGKSVVSKIYIAMLENITSLVVVPTVNDANEFCKDINDWSGDANYARCHYSINNKNSKTEYHVDKKEVTNYNCIVITHAMYILINENREIKLFGLLQSRKSKLVIIDERISLYKRLTIANDHVNGLINMCESIDNKTENSLTVDIEELRSIASIFEELTSEATDQGTNNIFMSKSSQQRQEIAPVKLDTISELLDNDSIIDIRDYITKLPGISLKETKRHVKRSTKELVDAIKMIGLFDFSFHKLGDIHVIMFTDNIEPLFGSVVVLDATATINEIYNKTAEHSAYWVQHIETEDPRIYNSLTIHKAKGHKQGRETIYEKQTKEDYTNNASNYIKLARTLMTELTDKMLIITFKEFDDLLIKQTKNTDRISITNWGNHVGKNKWSDHNKVMIIGWYRLPDNEHYGNFINTLIAQELVCWYMKPDTIKKFKETQIIDDLVQATMRSSARRMVNANGDCQKTEVYLFYPDNTEGSYIMSEFEKEFKGAKVVDWEPEILLSSYKPSKSTTNIDTIITYIDSYFANKKVDDKDYVKNSEIVTHTALSKTVVNRTISSKKLEKELNKRGYYKKKINKQSNGIFKK